MTVMATSDVTKKVLRFKLQLTESAESETVLKILQKLKDLDITLDILAETGIGKTVNSLRKHKLAGEFAKSLVKYWKELVPKQSTSNTADLEASQSVHFKGKVDDQNCPKNGSAAIDDPHDKSQDASSEVLMKTENAKHDNVENELQEETEHGNQKENVSNKPKTCNTLEKEDLNQKLENKEEKMDDSVASKKKRQSDRNLDNNDIELGSNNSGDHHRESKLVSREKSKGSLDKQKKFRAERESNKEQWASPKSISKQTVEDSCTSESRDKQSNILFDIAKAKDDKTSEMPCGSKAQTEKNKQPGERKQVRLKGKQKSIDEGKPNDTKNKKTKIKDEDKHRGHDLEVPNMSFESCLSYDLKAPKRKKRSGASKNPPKKPKFAEQEEPAKEPNMNSFKLPVTSENDDTDKKTQESVADLLHIPLPTLLHEWDIPSSVKEVERKAESISSSCEVPEESLVFTGQRLNTKMQVYSGTKTTFLPAMMSLYQQCIRILQNNIDMLYEIGGVPFDILQPVLERCTPEQLLRIEELNPVYIGATDDLWGRHCQRDFRNSKLKEYESWKEMYIRLSEERERKFKRLTRSIISAHSKKPKGRQVKLVTTDNKPTRNVRSQQRIHGTAGPLLHGTAGPLLHGTAGPLLHGTAGPIQQPHLPERPSVKRQEIERPRYEEPPKPSTSTTNSRTTITQDARKKTRVAPMMAKSLKAFKNQLGRR